MRLDGFGLLVEDMARMARMIMKYGKKVLAEIEERERLEAAAQTKSSEH